MQRDVDLLQMTNLVKYNDDLFSRYLWVRPLKTKTTAEVASMFEDILNTGCHCESLWGHHFRIS